MTDSPTDRPAGTGGPAPGPGDGLDLGDIRARIDAVDRRLVDLLAERAALVGEVVHYKRARHLPVVDRHREDEMLERIAVTAQAAGVDARVAQQVLRTIIDGFTLLEVEELGPDDV
ncbi:MAG TPA: chorismate mutase [Acidimicrobiales bacterium]|nr:chorismate mutase [Acidimicrobiales bacterium]